MDDMRAPAWHRFRVVLLILLVVAGALVGVAVVDDAPDLATSRQSVGDDVSPEGGVGVEPVAVPAQTQMQFSGLRDWRDFVDQIAVVEVESEEEVSPDASEGQVRRSYVGRSVSLRVIEPLWGAFDVPERLSMTTLGWRDTEEGGRQPLVAEGGTWLEVGQRYLVALSLYPSGTEGSPDEWGLHSPESGMRLSTSGALVADEQMVGPLASFVGREPRALVEAVAALPPDPVVERYRELGGATRYARAWVDRHPGASPQSGGEEAEDQPR